MSDNNEGRYLARSWALLTRDRGWIKPVLVLAVAQLVPIVGALGASGYALEWARLTAWGVDSAPKQRGVRVGECIASGWRAFVVSLGYGCAFMLAGGLFRWLLGNSPLGSLVTAALSLALSVVVAVAALRATVYQRIGAGYQLRRVWDMLRADTRGLLRIAGMMLALGLLTALVAGIVALLTLMPVFTQLAASAYGYGLLDYGYASSRDVMRWLAAALAGSMGSIVLALVVIVFVSSLASVVVELLTRTAVGLWMRQFDVPAWGKSEDPLPADASGAWAADPDAPAGGPAGASAGQEAAGGGAWAADDAWDRPATGGADGGYGATAPVEPAPAAATEAPAAPGRTLSVPAEDGPMMATQQPVRLPEAPEAAWATPVVEPAAGDTPPVTEAGAGGEAASVAGFVPVPLVPVQADADDAPAPQVPEAALAEEAAPEVVPEAPAAAPEAMAPAAPEAAPEAPVAAPDAPAAGSEREGEVQAHVMAEPAAVVEPVADAARDQAEPTADATFAQAEPHGEDDARA